MSSRADVNVAAPPSPGALGAPRLRPTRTGSRLPLRVTVGMAAALALAACTRPPAPEPDFPELPEADGEVSSSSVADAGPAAAEPAPVRDMPRVPDRNAFRPPPAPVLEAVGPADVALCASMTAGECEQLGLDHENGAGRPVDMRAAVQYHAAACSTGSSLACSNLAGFYGRRATKGERARADTLYGWACRAGHLSACHKRSFARAAGCLGKPKQPLCVARIVLPEDARRLQLSACERGEQESCVSAAGFLEPDRELELYRIACEAGEPLGCHNLADSGGGGGDPEALHAKACAIGFASSCMKAGMSRANRDRAGGRELIGRACSLGEPYACMLLETMPTP